MDDFVEIARFHRSEPLQACMAVLKAAAVDARFSNDSLTLDVASFQRGSNPSCIVTVPAEQLEQARYALLGAAREEVAETLDANHYLHSCDDQALLEVLKEPLESSEYELALAERLLIQRGIQPPEIRFPSPLSAATELRGEAHADAPLPGKKAGSALFITASFLFSIMGGFVGPLIGWGYAFSTETRSDGKTYYLYDDRTRKWGGALLIFGVLMIFLWINILIYR
jgi:hypothetical protein